MLHRRFSLLPALLPVTTGLCLIFLAGTIQAQETSSDRDEIVHVLNRITFGPRPGDVEMVQKMGLHNFIEQQLHPETIDDSAVDREVAGFELLQMTPGELTQLYLDEKKREKEKKKEALAQTEAATTANATVNPTMAPNQGNPPAPAPADQTMAQKEDAPPASTGATGQTETQVEPPPQVPSLEPGQGKVTIEKLAEVAGRWRTVAAIGQLEQAKLVRAVDSPRQLQEVLVDFWGNHFNIDMKKNLDRFFKVVDDREVIRPHIWGRFRDLLEASAKSPAMLVYLDNATNTVARNVSPMEQQIRAAYLQKMLGAAAPIDAAADGKPLKAKKMGGINENYAREIMELHTLGVDGGYTQQDVQEVARCFTGWTINRLTGEFIFRPRLHDDGAKVVLGHDIPAGGGMQDGETVLDILASSPATAHHISLELCQRFVSDDPPAPLVARIAGVFTQTGGDLRAVTDAILNSPEFLSPSDYNNKIKSPLEFAVSAVRASDSAIIPQQPPPFDKIVATMEGAAVLGRGNAADRIAKRPRQSLNYHILELGEPLFACTAPTGYKEVSKFWVSPGALIERLNFAMALTQQQVNDIRFSPQNLLAGTDLDKPEAVLNQCAAVLLQNNMSDSTRKVLEQTALPAPGESKTVNPSKLIALMIGSPEFQRK
jgi:uncharacterized protein (DUF1800 family)